MFPGIEGLFSKLGFIDLAALLEFGLLEVV